ncbi:BH3-interacting domain death agonist isoform X2 [Dipodomys spectabilis]|uniref:BH3-interacting domain death agonist isoform X1 n=1 Tax=Dipodomys spectabilis TaxID=105255 RepID=UPI001C537D43|nr:BH3-interacting domain death agonist isoform X1 [Dipodomys spectabilis]XP_042528069.1 BH3-interacting domain death agonist isoform X1 [Dipodomys spectabilis]XP_042528070.1 BH3-interacting domain death agonist isoform X1 [Dipodomys spectabilis]XP_042528071.1 BH3-interacting domain death agonist isoform X1 [Dipodomys spectabilis]XP_042528072.1 BH3-interacting domain death agonist isoform X1 [Dipodomys spectabilis]XP_042528073.1 BH3-interacting domain death agonist isoform X2 [Dipodomys specta
MDPEVSNAAGFGSERITSLLVFGFLQSSSDKFRQELDTLGHELFDGASPQPFCADDELQTDGLRVSRSYGRIEADSESQDEVIRSIARHLAQAGDEMEHRIRIHPGLVSSLASKFRDRSLREEDRRSCLASALKEVGQAYPKDMETEKATLIMAMLLARKVVTLTPSLCRDVFCTTVNFINQNLLIYVRNLVRNEVD